MIGRIEAHLLAATNEIQAYCQENEWVSEIKQFVTKFTRKQVLDWKAVGAYEVEENLNKIKLWMENIKGNIEPVKITANKLFKINCKPVELILIPLLENVFKEVCECILSEVMTDLAGFIKLIGNILAELNNKPKSIEDFSRYTNKFNDFKGKMATYEARVAGIKTSLEIVRVHYRTLNPDEEQMDLQAQELWKQFLAKVQETIVYVNAQSPSIIEQLSGLYKKYIEELRKIHHQATSGKYLDPYENSTQILANYKKLTNEFTSVEKILRQCAGWRETITQKREDLTFILRLAKQINTRKELWKFYEVTCEHVKDWKNATVRKIDVKRVGEKLDLWDCEAKSLRASLSEDDRVWLSWNNVIQSFRMIMRWICKLLDGTFRDDDFEELFAAIGKVYDRECEYTVQDFIDFKFDDYMDLINGIYKRAHINIIRYVVLFFFLKIFIDGQNQQIITDH